MAGGDWIDPVSRPNALTTARQETIAANAANIPHYSIWSDLDIEPTKSAGATMANNRMLFRPENNGFSLWIRALKNGTNSFQPFVGADTPFKLTFVLRIKNPAFHVFTMTETGPADKTFWYFSNRADNRFGHTNYLNATRPQINPPQNYASSLDRVACINSLTVDVAAAMTSRIRFVLAGPVHSAAWEFKADTGEGILKTCRLEPRGLPSGLYEMTAYGPTDAEIPALKRTFYWNAGDICPDAFGIVEIYHLPGDAPGSYAFFDTSGQLLNPTYTLWWQNRSTYWRYLFDSAQPAPDTANPACNVKLEDGSDSMRLITKERLPLQHRYRPVRYCISAGAHTEEVLLPNPDPDRIYPEGNVLFSEVYMNKIDYKNLFQVTFNKPYCT
ncbi:MAG: hypothetical protein IPM98_12950 [Lewinellaceae bacterium]|nr:hypothetical protein [Lewinellaceae bacterium]